jgi:hypothetical protein
MMDVFIKEDGLFKKTTHPITEIKIEDVIDLETKLKFTWRIRKPGIHFLLYWLNPYGPAIFWLQAVFDGDPPIWLCSDDGLACVLDIV